MSKTNHQVGQLNPDLQFFSTPTCPVCSYNLQVDSNNRLSETWWQSTACPACHFSFVD